MEHRHLLPNEIDLLLDGDAGFGLAPLRAHVRQCDACRAEVDAAREVLALLDDRPHFTPAPLFADRVMARVQVFEPWHVALRDSLLRLVPATRPARVAVAAGALTIAFTMTTALLALLARVDVVVFGWQLALDRAQTVLVSTLGGLLGAVFGDVAAGTLARSGASGMALGFVGLVGSVAVAALLLRSLTVAYHRQRS